MAETPARSLPPIPDEARRPRRSWPAILRGMPTRFERECPICRRCPRAGIFERTQP